MDIALRAAIAFCFIFFLTRVVGRRELGSMEPFDLILLVVLGDLIQQGVTQSDYSVTGLLVAASTMAILLRLVAERASGASTVPLLALGTPLTIAR